jgi:hypothetical protein
MAFGHAGTENIQLINSEPADVKDERILTVVFISSLCVQSKFFEIDIILMTRGPPLLQAVCGCE